MVSIKASNKSYNAFTLGKCKKKDEWMNKWMDVWVDRWMNEWMGDWVSAGVRNELVNEWVIILNFIEWLIKGTWQNHTFLIFFVFRMLKY